MPRALRSKRQRAGRRRRCRAAPAPLVLFSASMRAQSTELKQFLFRNLYRHPQVMQTADRAQQVVRELFAAYLGDASEMPASYAQRAEPPPRGGGLHRRHDRSFRDARTRAPHRPAVDRMSRSGKRACPRSCGGAGRGRCRGRSGPASRQAAAGRARRLQVTLGIGLVEAGFLLSLVQLAGMTLGLVVGLAADTIGLRRSMLAGLAVVTAASVAGGAVGTSPGATAVHLLLALRALEGVGFLLVVMPGPGLIRAMSPRERGEGGAGPVGRLHAAWRRAGAAARAGADRVGRLARLVVGAVGGLGRQRRCGSRSACPADSPRNAAPPRLAGALVDAPARYRLVRPGRGRWRWRSRSTRRSGWR